MQVAAIRGVWPGMERFVFFQLTHTVPRQGPIDLHALVFHAMTMTIYSTAHTISVESKTKRHGFAAELQAVYCQTRDSAASAIWGLAG